MAAARALPPCNQVSRPRRNADLWGRRLLSPVVLDALCRTRTALFVISLRDDSQAVPWSFLIIIAYKGFTIPNVFWIVYTSETTLETQLHTFIINSVCNGGNWKAL